MSIWNSLSILKLFKVGATDGMTTTFVSTFHINNCVIGKYFGVKIISTFDQRVIQLKTLFFLQEQKKMGADGQLCNEQTKKARK